MPFYEYTCQDCGNAFELLVRSDTVPACPSCNATHLEKKLSVFATSAHPAPPAPGPCAACPGRADGGGGCAFA